MRVPPRFGRTTGTTGESPVTFQAADAPPDESPSAAAPDAEESMTAPFPHRGSSVPDAEQTTPSPAAQDPAAQDPAAAAAPGTAAGADSPAPPGTASPTAPRATSPTTAGAPFATSPGAASPNAAYPTTAGASRDAAGKAPWTPAGDAPAGTSGAVPEMLPGTPPNSTQAGPGGTFRPSAEKAANDVLEPENGLEDDLENSRQESRALAVARVAAGPAPAAETATPPLIIPDAILPPGFTPREPEEPEPEPEMDATRPTPTIGSGEPGGPFAGGRRASPSGGSPGTGRSALLIGGGALAALLLGGGAVVAYTTASDTAGRHPVVRHTPAAPPPAAARPSPSQPAIRHRPKPKLVRVDIRDEKKDPVPLGPGEVFPAHTMKVAGHTFAIAKTVLNNHCALTANGSFGAALTQQHCRTVVRATLVSDDKKIAVTAGVAAMPTDAAAIAALKAQDPAHYNWFRGLKADGAPKIDGPGGAAASVRRGRYICYAYVVYADGHKPKKGDKTLQQVAGGFRDAVAKPINRRARSKVPQR